MHGLAVAFPQGTACMVLFQQTLHDAARLLGILKVWCAGEYIRLHSREPQCHHICEDHPVR